MLKGILLQSYQNMDEELKSILFPLIASKILILNLEGCNIFIT